MCPTGLGQLASSVRIPGSFTVVLVVPHRRRKLHLIPTFIVAGNAKRYGGCSQKRSETAHTCACYYIETDSGSAAFHRADVVLLYLFAYKSPFDWVNSGNKSIASNFPFLLRCTRDPAHFSIHRPHIGNKNAKQHTHITSKHLLSLVMNVGILFPS